ncbi:MAG: gamma-glutamyl-gamma-aminobutyrate hydrolase family protein [Planctomycetota bacterium]
MSRAPLIAINGLYESAGGPKVTLRQRYPDAVVQAGGVPVVIPPVGLDLGELLERVDGVVFSGGDDFDMERLGRGATHPAATPTHGPKQDFDFALAEACLEREIPTLGICYGMQVLALTGPCPLLQHLPEDRPEAGNHSGGVEHPVELAQGTKLAALLGVRILSVVSRHHQAIGAAAGGWRVAATDSQGLIEAIERDDHPFALGVQWHPELSAPETPHGRLFEGLVEAAREYARSREAVGEETSRW